jgi:hypothetical protein
VLKCMAEGLCGGLTGMVGVETHGWGSKRIIGVKMHCGG